MASSGAGQRPSNPPMAADAPAVAIDAKLMMATSRGDCQRLKDLLNKEDATAMVVVMVSTAAKPPQATMNSRLLQYACQGKWQALGNLLDGLDAPGRSHGVPTQGADRPALLAAPLLEGVTVEGDTALHAAATYGDADNYLRSADVIYGKAKKLLFAPNRKGDTPLHCAARAGKYHMVSHLIRLAEAEDEGDEKLKELVRKENGRKETALHEAVRIGNKHIVELLMEADSELGNFPQDDTSPLYLAILLEKYPIAASLYDKSKGNISYSGPNGQNVLHAAVLRGTGMAEMVLKWKEDLTEQADQNGSTPLHFAASLLRIGVGVRVLIFQRWFPWFSFVWYPEVGGGQRVLIFQRRFPWFSFVRYPEIGVGERVLIFQRRFPWFPCFPIVLYPVDQLLRANPAPLYQPDYNGLFPIHVAASSGSNLTAINFINKSPDIAGLRDAKGRTFLHVAVQMKKWNIVAYACETPKLAWILNMQDNDGNTALHLAVQIGVLPIFCSLLKNRGVHLNLTNNNGETPLDLSRRKIRAGFFYGWNPGYLIYRALTFCHARHGNLRFDHFQEQCIPQQKPEDEVKESDKLTSSTQTLGIGSVLIVTVTFGATFALPGGYKADDHYNGGTPTLAGRYCFDAFIMANTIAFICSALATISLMYSGMAMVDLPIRRRRFNTSLFFAFSSVTSLAAAFALAVYLVLAPVVHMTAIAICALVTVVSFIGYTEPLSAVAVAKALRLRLGNRTFLAFANVVFNQTLLIYWPMVIILSWAAISTKYGHR